MQENLLSQSSLYYLSTDRVCSIIQYKSNTPVYTTSTSVGVDQSHEYQLITKLSFFLKRMQKNLTKKKRESARRPDPLANDTNVIHIYTEKSKNKFNMYGSSFFGMFLFCNYNYLRPREKEEYTKRR